MSELQDVYRLQAFVTVVEEGSISAAVGKLHLTQPALSSRLKLLEESMGCLLLERTGKGVCPTPIGRLVYQHAVEILRRMGDLQRTLHRHINLQEGWVHLTGGSTAVAGIFPDTIEAFREGHPDIRFSVRELDLQFAVEAVRDGSADIGIVTKSREQPSSHDNPLANVEVHATIRDELVLIASPKHPLAQNSRALKSIGKSILSMHLNRQNMILPSEGTVIRDVVDSEFGRLCVRPLVVMSLRSTAAILQMVERNMGVSVVSRRALTGGAQVEIIDVEGVRWERELVVIGPRERSLMPASEAFLQLLVERCSSNETAVTRNPG